MAASDRSSPTAEARDRAGRGAVPALAGADAVRVRPGQVWSDHGPQSRGAPIRVIAVDSTFAYCRAGQAGDGAPGRIPLAHFDERGSRLTLVAEPEGPEDVVLRRALTALWQLDYLGEPRTTEQITALLAGRYEPDEIASALAEAERDGLVAASVERHDDWRLTGGGRRIAAVG